MQVLINGKQVAVSAALHEHAILKAHKACEHLTNPPAQYQVILSKEAHSHRAEMVLHYHGRDFVAHSDTETDLYDAIDAAAIRMRRQLENFNQREHEHR